MDNDRYSRQIRFHPIGAEGQSALARKHVLIMGAGALGSSAAEILTRAGIGTLTVIDRDYVEPSNLQRQSLYRNADAEAHMPKAIAARQRLIEINPDVDIRAYVADPSARELEELAAEADLLLDGTDNFETRFLLNDLSHKRGIPWIYGACAGGAGAVFTIRPGITPCLSCLLQSGLVNGESCDIGGILAPAVQTVAAHQAVEALKLLTGNHSALRTAFLSFDLWRNQHIEVDISGMRHAACPTCGERPTYPHLSSGRRMKAAVLCGRDTVQLRLPHGLPLTLDQLEDTLTRLEGTVERNPYLLAYSFQGKRLVFFPDGRVLVHGTSRITEAKRLYHALLG
ncbi:ThiF family adenylyltransferase [Gorillibacterium sp. sgz500922]|uniref:ThiF family adenylyltransferase n=1 Tax=Gorillibacterium sp. sgz500922 TaxID=3446694 RepID=UPI003F678BD5